MRPIARVTKLNQRAKRREDRVSSFVHCRSDSPDSPSRLWAGTGRHVHGYHSHAIQDDVWALYDHVMELCFPEFVIIERDDNFRGIAELAAEVRRARGRSLT